MLGAFTAGKKAAKFGYKKFGVPGALVAGAGGAAGAVVAKKGLKRAVQAKADSSSSDLEADVETGSFGDETDADDSDGVSTA